MPSARPSSSEEKRETAQKSGSTHRQSGGRGSRSKSSSTEPSSSGKVSRWNSGDPGQSVCWCFGLQPPVSAESLSCTQRKTEGAQMFFIQMWAGPTPFYCLCFCVSFLHMWHTAVETVFKKYSVKVLHYSKVLLSKKTANKNHRKYFLKTYFKNKQLKQMPFLWLYITFSLRISFLVISLKNYKKQQHSVIVCLLFVLICS